MTSVVVDSDHNSYNPNATVQEVYDLFKEEFIHLDKDDFTDIVRACNIRCM